MVCDVAMCPAIVVPGSRFCELHKLARTAKELRIGPDKKGLGAASCATCGRRFKDADYVLRDTVNRKQRTTTIAAYRHVKCEPTTPRPTRRQLRERAKPLLDTAADGLDDPPPAVDGQEPLFERVDGTPEK